MADLSGVKITRGQQGANALAGGDYTSGLIIEAISATGLVLNTVATIYQPKDAEALGINATFDTTNSVNAYRHIKEFYRLAGVGKPLYIMLVPRGAGLTTIFENTSVAAARRLLIEGKGTIKQIAACVNPITEGTSLNQLTADCYNAIPLAQGFYNWANDNFMPCQILLEGRNYGGTAASAGDLRAISSLSATKVSVVIGQDYNYAHGLWALGKKFADVGTALGTLAAAEINQNIGDNEAFNLTDATLGAWMVPGLSNHKPNTEQFEDLQTLENKSYIFGLEYAGYEGVRWNNDHVCAPIIIDADGNMNEHTISLGRTHDKAVRLLRTAYLPKVKSKQPVDPKTGLLPVGVVKNFDGIGNTVFAEMQKRTEISSGITVTDPNSDLLIAKELEVGYEFVPYGMVGSIKGVMNIKNRI